VHTTQQQICWYNAKQNKNTRNNKKISRKGAKMTLNQIYIYVIPGITITTTLYFIYFLAKTKNINKIFEENLKKLREKEEEEFDNFIRTIQKEKKEVLEKCVSNQTHLAQKIDEYNEMLEDRFQLTIQEMKKNAKISKNRIDELEKEVIKYKNICSSKVAQIERLKRENFKLKKAE
jgi:predicted RNase H-like nuclease (RuvC/YqgF family)